MSGLIIRNGRVICPATRRDSVADVWVENGIITRIQPDLGGRTPGKATRSAPSSADAPDGFDVVDASGLIVAPGFIDLHVHFREPWPEDREAPETIESGTAAAAAGGFTSVCTMPNSDPVNDNVEITRFILDRARRSGKVRVFPIAAVTESSDGKSLTDFDALRAAGAVAFSDDGKPVFDQFLMREALGRVRGLETFVSDHCEDLALTRGGMVHEGEVSTRLGLPGIPRRGEDVAVKNDIILAKQTHGHVHIAHISTAGALDLVRKGKQEGVNVTCEVTPHHFSLTDEDVKTYGANAKMKPPLREGLDVEALIGGMVDGTVDAIATDHAPHVFAEKSKGLRSAPFGITGLETAVALAIQKLVETGRINWMRLVELVSTAPARILHRPDLGCIGEGALADLTIIHPDLQWTFLASESRSKSRNTPFDRWTFRGKVVMTVVGGKVAFEARVATP